MQFQHAQKTLSSRMQESKALMWQIEVSQLGINFFSFVVWEYKHFLGDFTFEQLAACCDLALNGWGPETNPMSGFGAGSYTRT